MGRLTEILTELGTFKELEEKDKRVIEYQAKIIEMYINAYHEAVSVFLQDSYNIQLPHLKELLDGQDPQRK